MFATAFSFCCISTVTAFAGAGARHNVSQMTSALEYSALEPLHDQPMPVEAQLACILARRTAMLDTARDHFFFTHISKASGASAIAQIKKIVKYLLPIFTEGDEASLPYNVFSKRFPWTSLKLLNMIRSPRDHVKSMYKECRYLKWGMQVSHDLSLLGKPHVDTNKTLSKQKGLRNWVRHYTSGHPPGYRPMVPFLGCYQPWNYQSRALTVHHHNPHDELFHPSQLCGQPPCPTDARRAGLCMDGVDPVTLLRPDAATALRNLYNVDWVGITDFYHTSMCLLFARLSRSTAATQYVDDECRCPPRGEMRDTHNTHEDTRHNRNLRHNDTIPTQMQISNETTALIDFISAVDRAVFKVSLNLFFVEVKTLEAKLGRRVLCQPALDKNHKKLMYIGDIIHMYEAAQVVDHHTYLCKTGTDRNMCKGLSTR